MNMTENQQFYGGGRPNEVPQPDVNPTPVSPGGPATPAETPPVSTPVEVPAEMPSETGGAKGPEPTRYGDWEHKGRVSDF